MGNIARPSQAPFNVAFAGARPGPIRTERALRMALNALEASGARTLLLTGAYIDMPNHSPEQLQLNARLECFRPDLRLGGCWWPRRHRAQKTRSFPR